MLVRRTTGVIVTVVLGVCSVTSFNSCSSARKGSPDLVEYIAGIRRAGMSEGATSTLRTAARILVGQIRLERKRDAETGEYSTTMMSTSCPPRASSESVARFKAAQDAEIERVIPLLREAADRDRSGFVTREEADAFWRTLEFGFLAASVVSQEGAKRGVLEHALSKNSDEVTSAIARYRNLMLTLPASIVEKCPPLSAISENE